MPSRIHDFLQKGSFPIHAAPNLQQTPLHMTSYRHRHEATKHDVWANDHGPKEENVASPIWYGGKHVPRTRTQFYDYEKFYQQSELKPGRRRRALQRRYDPYAQEYLSSDDEFAETDSEQEHESEDSEDYQSFVKHLSEKKREKLKAQLTAQERKHKQKLKPPKLVDEKRVRDTANKPAPSPEDHKRAQESARKPKQKTAAAGKASAPKSLPPNAVNVPELRGSTQLPRQRMFTFFMVAFAGIIIVFIVALFCYKFYISNTPGSLSPSRKPTPSNPNGTVVAKPKPTNLIPNNFPKMRPSLPHGTFSVSPASTTTTTLEKPKPSEVDATREPHPHPNTFLPKHNAGPNPALPRAKKVSFAVPENEPSEIVAAMKGHGQVRSRELSEQN